MTFEQLDRSIDADSDSEDEAAEQAHLYRSKCMNIIFSLQILTILVARSKGKTNAEPTEAMAGLSLDKSGSPPRVSPPAQPPRPVQPPNEESDQESVEEDDDDEDNPFGDRNALPTYQVEKSQPRW